MSLDLGELAGRLMLDIGPLKRDVAESKTELRGVVSSAEDAGNDAGEGFSRNWGDSAKKGAVAAGAAFGTAVVIGLHGAMDREAAGARLTAQLGLNPQQQERLGKLAGSLYANAYGDSIDQVNDSIAAVRTSMDHLGHGELRSATKDALNFASAFDVDVSRSVQIVSQLINTGLVKNSREGFNILIAASQRVPAAIREDLLDAADEYGQFFAGLGYTGRQAFGVLVDASSKGMYGLDKAGDAVKEFTIRSTDMSTTTKQAYRMIGLDWHDMTNDILAGGDRAHDATQKIIQGLLDIEDPGKRAQAALLLFGTPLEDLNTKDIPKFLSGLQDTGHHLDDVRGSAHEVNKALGSTADADFTKLKRRLQNDLIDIMEKALPIIEDDVIPAIEGIGNAFDKIPSWAVKGTLGGLLGLYAAGKLGSLFSDLRGLRGGTSVAGGIAGKVASKLDPVPVIVMNDWGKDGLPDVVPDGPDKPGEKPLSKAGKIAQYGAYATTAAFIGYGLYEGQKDARRNLNSWAMTGPAGQSHGGSSEPSQVDAVTRLQVQLSGADQASGGATHLLEAFLALPKKVQTEVAVQGTDLSKREVKDLIAQYDLTPSQMKTLFDNAGIPNSIREVQNLIAQQSNVPKDVTTAYHLNGIEAALQQISTLRNNINTLPDVGDHSLPFAHGGGRSAGGGSNGRIKLVVGEREMDAYVDDRASRQVNANDDWHAAVGG